MSSPSLTSREVYQLLKDLALGVRTVQRLEAQARGGLWLMEAEGWRLSVQRDRDALEYCESCHAPDGRAYHFDTRQRFGTDPLELLSTWERQQLENLLKKQSRI
ncbi:hypothetical protein [Pseudomonas sp. NPDC089401]|uniref:DUF7693 family protein n=1 Tax=Pseudomonas sp. NPDC089401 TaxID=3364462 RepID=UPI003827EAC8